jgi:hypothetical protein
VVERYATWLFALIIKTSLVAGGAPSTAPVATSITLDRLVRPDHPARSLALDPPSYNEPRRLTALA